MDPPTLSHIFRWIHVERRYGLAVLIVAFVSMMYAARGF